MQIKILDGQSLDLFSMDGQSFGWSKFWMVKVQDGQSSDLFSWMVKVEISFQMRRLKRVL